MKQGISARNEHARFLMDRLLTMKNDETVCDLTIKVGSTSFRVHRAVLVACSDYFRRLITDKMVEVQKGRVDLVGVEPEVFRIFLQFIYTGEADVTSTNCCSVLRTSDKLQCCELKNQCIHFIERNMNVGNCLKVKGVGIEELSRKAEAFAAEHIKELEANEDFLALERGEFVQLLRNTKRDIEALWKPVINWIAHVKDRKTVFHNILCLFDLPKASFIFLFETVWTEPLIQNEASSKEKVAKAILLRLKRKDLTESNCFEMRSLARYYSALGNDSLSKKIWPFMAKNLHTVSQRSEFMLLEKTEIEKLYEDRHTWSNTTWAPLVKWLKVKRKKRMSVFLTILQNINDKDVTFNFIFDTMLGESSLRASKQFIDITVSLLLRVMEYKDLNTDNCLDILQLLKGKLKEQTPKFREVYKQVQLYISKHLDQLTKKEGFLRIDKECLVQILCLRIERNFDENGLHTCLPDIAWDAVSAWIRFNQRSRSSHMEDILAKVGPSRFSFPLLLETIVRDPIVRDHPECEKLVISAIFSKVHYSNLYPEVCIQIIKFVRQHPSERAEHVIGNVHGFMKSNFEKMVEDDEFEELTSVDITRLLGCEDLKSSEESKWKGALEWLKFDSNERKKFLPDILVLIQLEKLPIAFVRKEIFAEDMVRNSEECKTIIIDALLHEDDDDAGSSREASSLDPGAKSYHRNADCAS